MIHWHPPAAAGKRWLWLPRGAAFSLIELLVVLAILAILASLYFRAFSGGAPAKVRKACANNLQRLFIALDIYATDNGGRFPQQAGASKASEALDCLLPRYTVDTTAFVCPGSKVSPPPSGQSIAGRRISYAYYMGRKRDPTGALMSDEQVDTTSKVAGQMAFSTTGAAPGNNHQNQGGNVLFSDGRVEESPPCLSFSLVFTQGVVLLNP